MVVADYHMKRLANGTDSVRVRGFASLTRLLRERVRSAEAGGSGSIELSPLDRFWFESGRCTFEEDEGIARLTVCTVVLRTQEQHVSSSGQATDTGRQNALAEEFAREFTAHYSEISGQRTEYSELEALFRLVALARILKTSVGESHVSSLLSSYPLPLTTHPRQLPGLSHVERVYQRWSNPRGYSEQRLWIPSCGGVTMNVRPARETASTTRRSELRRLKSAVLKSRPGPRALAWKVAGVS
jgi:hypothetical protein